MTPVSKSCDYLPQEVSSEKLTQKSMSRFPLPPNSRSPTWKVTVILSSECSSSWKHSRECALSWMLCAELTAKSPQRAA